jgi:hypothetical protein
MSDNDTTNVVPSLEVSSLETRSAAVIPVHCHGCSSRLVTRGIRTSTKVQCCSELWVWGISAHYLGGIFDTSKSELRAAWRGPHARERRCPTTEAARPTRVESCLNSVISLREVV